MPWKLEHLTGEPIVIVTVWDRVDFEKDTDKALQQIAKHVDEIGDPTYVIADMSEIVMNFGDMVLGLAHMFSGKPGSGRDPRIRTVMVGSQGLVGFAAKSVRQLQYGGLDVPLY